jgi:hypothetical protein
MKSQKPLSRKDNIVVQELDGEVMIYDLAKDRAFCLNETSALVWQACDGTKTTAEITEFISRETNSQANEDLIWFALDQLKKENLIVKETAVPSPFEGMGRREVIKKVGLSTLLALPVIMSLTSPTAAQTASTCVPFGACTCNNTMFNQPQTGTCGSQDCMTGATMCVCGSLTCTGVAGSITCSGQCQV